MSDLNTALGQGSGSTINQGAAQQALGPGLDAAGLPIPALNQAQSAISAQQGGVSPQTTRQGTGLPNLQPLSTGALPQGQQGSGGQSTNQR
jgi:hypothetical protein